MIKPPPNVLDLPLHERAEMALKAAVKKNILQSARGSACALAVAGTPYVILVRVRGNRVTISTIWHGAQPRNR
jgi:hypothetical protein